MIEEDLIKAAVSVANKKELDKHTSIGSVGSALVTDRGNVYKGCNLDCNCGMGFCAEVGAIASMISRGETRIRAIVAVRPNGVPLPPCGKCRELIYQLDAGNLETDVILKDKTVKLRALLPELWDEDRRRAGQRCE